MEQATFLRNGYGRMLLAIDSVITKPQYARIKRFIDFSIASLLFIITFPLLILLCAVLVIEHKAWPIYRQRRGLTIEGRQFNIYKFKTIKKEGQNAPLLSRSVFLKPDLSTYVSAFGCWLRKTGLDEIPQLLNVLKGDMAFIGPRPLSISDLEILQAENPDLYIRRQALNLLPGISGTWQLFGNREEGMKNLIELDELYAQKQCLSYDMFLFLRTIPVLFSASHSDSILKSNK